jgi:hypothetical protein
MALKNIKLFFNGEIVIKTVGDQSFFLLKKTRPHYAEGLVNPKVHALKKGY